MSQTCPIHTSRCALLSLFLLVTAGSGKATPSYEIVAEKDQPAPAPAGGSDSTYNDFNSLASISSSGDITMAGVAVDLPSPDFRGAFWYRAAAASTVELLARTEEPATGVSPSANFSSIASPITPVGPVNSLGDGAFLAGIPGTISSGADLGIWLGKPGALTKVALGNEAAAVIGGGALYEEIHPPVLSDSGSLAFRTELQGTGVDGSNNVAIYAGTPGALTLVAREGSTAPGLPAGTHFSTLHDPLIDPTGQVCFCATTNGATFTSGYWAGPPAGITPIVLQGDAAPGLSAGTTLGSLDAIECRPAWNGTQVAFSNFVDDNGTDRIGIWAGAPGSLTLIAATGVTAPGMSIALSPSTSSFSGGMIGNPVVSASGHMAFRARLDTADPGVTGSDDDVIFYGPIGNVQPLLREGDLMPGTTRTLSSLGFFDAFEMGPDGSLAFEVSTSPGVFQDEIWVARPDTSIVPLALNGQLISAGGGDWVVDGANFVNSGAVSSFVDRTGHNGSDGRPGAFGPNGQFVFMATIAPASGGGNRQAIVLANLDGAPPSLLAPGIRIIAGVPGAQDVRIELETITGQDYSVYRYDDFPSSATRISGPTAGTGGTLNIDDTGALLDARRFYYAEAE